MEGTVGKNDQSLKYRKSVAVLLFISLICTVFSSVQYFIEFNIQRNSFDNISIISPSFFSLIYLSLYILPTILFLIYILHFYKHSNSSFLVPIIFALPVVTDFLLVISNLYQFRHLEFPVFFSLFRVFGFVFTFLLLVIPIVDSITRILAAISAFKGLSNKIFIALPFVWMIISSFFWLLNLIDNFDSFSGAARIVYILLSIASISGSITFSAAVFLFGLKNRIPSIPSLLQGRKNNLSPEQALRRLRNDFSNGLITEEEYQSQRTEIISKL